VQTGSPSGFSPPAQSFPIETVAVLHVEGQPHEVNSVDHEVRLESAATLGYSSTVLVVHEDRPATHSNPIIQQDMELWRRICKCDKKAT